MGVPFMRAYVEELVRTCHRRSAHAIGGMAAFIPSRRDPEANDRAMARVREDKERESSDGFDGTWVAHPDLVPLARDIFGAALGSAPNQKDRLRQEVATTARDLLDLRVPESSVTEAGVRTNISVGLAYLFHWNGKLLDLHWAFLLVFVIYLLIALILGYVGYRKVRKVRGPEKAIAEAQNIKQALTNRGS